MLYWYCQEKFAVGHSWDLNKVCTESWILEKVLEFAQQFSRLGKSLEKRVKVWKKMVKSLEVFWKLEQDFTSEIFFLLVKSYSILPVCLQCIIEKGLFLVFLRSILITYLITLRLEKEIIVLEKVWKNSWILDPKICTNPVKGLLICVIS